MMNKHITPTDAMILCTKTRHFFVTSDGVIVNYTGSNSGWVSLRLIYTDEFSGPMDFITAKALSIRIFTDTLAIIQTRDGSDYMPFVDPKIGKKIGKKIGEMTVGGLTKTNKNKKKAKKKDRKKNVRK
jgi:hypothetical protein